MEDEPNHTTWSSINHSIHFVQRDRNEEAIVSAEMMGRGGEIHQRRHQKQSRTLLLLYSIYVEID
jgi:hypothetical protein